MESTTVHIHKSKISAMLDQRVPIDPVSIPDGRYAMCGPAVNGNPEGFHANELVRRGKCPVGFKFSGVREPYDDVKEWLSTRDIDGIAWYHPDGRVVAVTKADFGLARKPASRS